MTVTIGPSSTVVLSRDPGETECEVCVTDGASPQCSSTDQTLKSAGDISLEFRCLKPEDVFTMKMITIIGKNGYETSYFGSTGLKKQKIWLQ